MADRPGKLERESEPGAAGEGSGGEGRASWRSAWPMPVLLLAAALLGAGMVTAIVTRPRMGSRSPLEVVRSLYKAQQYAEALEVLNRQGAAWLEKRGDKLPANEKAEFHLLRANSLVGAQGQVGVDREENNRQIVADYLAGERLGTALSSEEVVALVMAQVSLGEMRAAAERVRRMGDEEEGLRRRLLKAVVEASLRSGHGEFEETQRLLMELAQEPDLPVDEAAWTLGRQAELLTASGRADEAVTKMLREMQRLRGVEPSREGELCLILARAYIAAGQPPEAQGQLDRAGPLLEAGNPMVAEVELLSGQLRQASGQLGEARERFARVVAEFATSPAYLPALAGLGEVKASLGDDEGALEAYAELVEGLGHPAPHTARPEGLTPEAVSEGLMRRHEELVQTGEGEMALRYAELAESLFIDGENKPVVPPTILAALAVAHRRLADEAAGRNEEVEGAGAAGGEARRHYLAAGEYFTKHARRVVVEEPAEASRAMFSAGDSYDLGGGLEMAIKLFGEYGQGASDDDPERAHAKFRLAQALEARGEHGPAAGLYKELVDGRGAPGERSTAVLWADRSVVPLARCMLTDHDEGNDEAALEHLVSVVEGRNLEPAAREFRDALVELGVRYYAAGRYAEAMRRLDEAVERFPEDREVESLRFKLADSARLSAAEIDRTLLEAMPQARREELERVRVERRHEAVRLFEQVKASLGRRAPESLTELERLFVRNCDFYLGDLAFDLGDYEGAIAAYDTARQKYGSDPATLVAMVQIVNAYVRQGEWSKAATANERARQQLTRFPDEVWATPNLPMEKKHWERWLDSRALLEQRAEAGKN